MRTWWALDGYEWAMVAVLAIAVLLPAAFVLRVVVLIVIEKRRRRADDARRVWLQVEGIGELSSTDDKSWDGTVGGLNVSIEGPGGPPPPAELVACMRRALSNVPEYLEKCRVFLATDEGIASLGLDPERVEVEGLRISDAESVVIVLCHPDDAEATVYVEFRAGEAVGSWFDH